MLRIQRVYHLIDGADSKFKKGDLEGAFSSIREALKISSTNDEAYFELGSIYWRLGRTGEAIEAFKKALSINPKIAVYIKQLPKLGMAKIPESLLSQLQI